LAGSGAVAVAVLVASGAVIGATMAGHRRPQPQRTVYLTPPPPPPLPQQLSAPAPSAQHPPKPVIGMNQTAGDSLTGFVVIGRGWPPGQPVTIALTGVRASPGHPRADSAGTFNYAINQDHEFFGRGLTPRKYQVVVTAPGGAKAVTGFTVNRR
jgi:hypothetical protein